MIQNLSYFTRETDSTKQHYIAVLERATSLKGDAKGDQEIFWREPALRMLLAAVTKLSFTPVLTRCSETCGPMSKIRDIFT